MVKGSRVFLVVIAGILVSSLGLAEAVKEGSGKITVIPLQPAYVGESDRAAGVGFVHGLEARLPEFQVVGDALGQREKGLSVSRCQHGLAQLFLQSPSFLLYCGSRALGEQGALVKGDRFPNSTLL